MEKEEFLMKLAGVEDEDGATSARLQYYNKVKTNYLMTDQVLVQYLIN